MPVAAGDAACEVVDLNTAGRERDRRIGPEALPFDEFTQGSASPIAAVSRTDTHSAARGVHGLSDR